MTDAPRHHVWDLLGFCERCGASLVSIKRGERSEHCTTADNVIGISHIIAERRFNRFVGPLLGPDHPF